MALRIYPNYPLASPIGQTDTFTGTGAATLFPITLNTDASIAGYVQFDAIPYIRLLGGFTTPDSTHILTTGAPPANSQGIAPATQALTFNAFDVPVIGSNTSANVVEVPFWLGDPGDGIMTNEYIAYPGNPGIALMFQNLVTATGAQVTWTQLACANADGTVGTYQATGTTLYTDQLSAMTTLSASSGALATTLIVAQASGFYPGDYIVINPGGGTFETVKITSINYGTRTLTITGTNFSHLSGENILVNARKFWAKVTYPIGILNGTATTFYNLAISFISAIAARF